MCTKHRHELRYATKARHGSLVDPSLLSEGDRRSKNPILIDLTHLDPGQCVQELQYKELVVSLAFRRQGCSHQKISASSGFRIWFGYSAQLCHWVGGYYPCPWRLLPAATASDGGRGGGR